MYRIVNIFLFFSLIYMYIPKASYGQTISCYRDKPFKTKDITCADFSQVCIKQNDADCDSFIDTCKQCPVSNTTLRTLLGLLTSSKELLEKKMELMETKINAIAQQQKINSENIFDSLKGMFIAISILSLILLLISIVFVIILVRRIRVSLPVFKRGLYENIKDTKMETSEIDNLIANPKDFKLQNNLDGLLNKMNVLEIKFAEIHGHVNKSNADHCGSLIKFKVKNREKPIELYVTSDDNVVQIKRQICAKYIDGKLNYKTMQLKYKDRILDNNQYLLSNVESINDIVQCEINDAINPSDIVILKMEGNMRIPNCIQINKNQTIADLKKIISRFNNSMDIKILKERIELDDRKTVEDCVLMDNDTIQVIGIENGHLIMHSIVGDADPILIEYSNVDLVSSVKKKLSDKLSGLCDEILLYYNGKYLDGDKFIFDFIILRSDIEYWRLLKLNRLKISGNPIKMGNLSKIFPATDTTSKKDTFVKIYELESKHDWKENKAIVNELRKYRLTKSHPRFVQVGKLYFDEKKFGVSMEHLEQSMRDFMELTTSPVPENQIAKWSKQILEGLQALHKHKVVYRDMKSSDIFLDKYNDIKISGFSLSKYVECDSDCRLRGFARKPSSNIRYSAPEVMNTNQFAMHSDVWSFGAIILKMVTGSNPYQGIPIKDLTRQIKDNQEFELKFKPGTTTELQLFIRCCLQTNPKDRPTVEELLQNKFLKIHKL